MLKAAAELLCMFITAYWLLYVQEETQDQGFNSRDGREKELFSSFKKVVGLFYSKFLKTNK